MQQDFPKLYHSLLVNRNNAWLPNIEHLLQTSELELVLIGALHLVGKEGLVAQLTALGYQVELLSFE